MKTWTNLGGGTADPRTTSSSAPLVQSKRLLLLATAASGVIGNIGPAALIGSDLLHKLRSWNAHPRFDSLLAFMAFLALGPGAILMTSVGAWLGVRWAHALHLGALFLSLLFGLQSVLFSLGGGPSGMGYFVLCVACLPFLLAAVFMTIAWLVWAPTREQKWPPTPS